MGAPGASDARSSGLERAVTTPRRSTLVEAQHRRPRAAHRLCSECRAPGARPSGPGARQPSATTASRSALVPHRQRPASGLAFAVLPRPSLPPSLVHPLRLCSLEKARWFSPFGYTPQYKTWQFPKNPDEHCFSVKDNSNQLITIFGSFLLWTLKRSRFRFLDAGLGPQDKHPPRDANHFTWRHGRNKRWEGRARKVRNESPCYPRARTVARRSSGPRRRRTDDSES